MWHGPWKAGAEAATAELGLTTAGVLRCGVGGGGVSCPTGTCGHSPCHSRRFRRNTPSRAPPERVQGVVGILVTAPYYGARRPAGQEAWFLQQVSDAFAQAWAVALEAVALLHWARGRWAVPLAVTGVSYGAAMAALTSKLYPGPLAVVPFMGCSGPGEPFAHGASVLAATCV